MMHKSLYKNNVGLLTRICVLICCAVPSVLSMVGMSLVASSDGLASINDIMLVFAIAGIFLTFSGYLMFDEYENEYDNHDCIINDFSWLFYWTSIFLYIFGIIISFILPKLI